MSSRTFLNHYGLTKIANEEGFLCIWSPFSIYNLILGTKVETKFEITLCKVLIAALMVVDGVLPTTERVMPFNYGRNIWPEIAIDVNDNLWIKRGLGHDIRGRVVK
jgi:hypothetical protein